VNVYNTLTRQKEEFLPAGGETYKIYVCGPTVYNYFHVGNARCFSLFDTLRRYLEYRGFQVKYVQNFTDVDDKIIRKANEEQITCGEVTARFIEEYFTDAHGLNIRDADVHPRATEHIGDIVAMVEALIEKGHAYEAGGDVYFSTKSFDEYGKLSHQPLEDLEAGARIMVGEIKREPMDFALWKAAKPGEPSWESPWGLGRPGWHIECSAMSKRHLGETIDLHCGGEDLVFPHHENEVAQSECCNGAMFSRFWMHNGYINVDNVKMSKSLGNFFTVRDVAEQYGYEPIRYLLIACHYRSPFNYSVDSIEQAKAALQRLYTCRDNLDFAAQSAGAGEDAALIAALEQHKADFIAAMEEDFNTADALGCVFSLVRDINAKVIDGKAGRAVCDAAAALFDELTGVLGLVYQRKQAESLDDVAEALIQKRQQARAEKNWALADEIRAQLSDMGITIEDTAQGTKIIRA